MFSIDYIIEQIEVAVKGVSPEFMARESCPLLSSPATTAGRWPWS